MDERKSLKFQRSFSVDESNVLQKTRIYGSQDNELLPHFRKPITQKYLIGDMSIKIKMYT